MPWARPCNAGQADSVLKRLWRAGIMRSAAYDPPAAGRVLSANAGRSTLAGH